MCIKGKLVVLTYSSHPYNRLGSLSKYRDDVQTILINIHMIQFVVNANNKNGSLTVSKTSKEHIVNRKNCETHYYTHRHDLFIFTFININCIVIETDAMHVFLW